MLSNLPYSTVSKKIKFLTNQITKSLGVVPRSFRAGRWGFGPQVAAAIRELGYSVDTSVTPLVDWSAYSGPDFRAAPPSSYQFNPTDVQLAVPNGSLLEVPATIGFLQNNYALCRRINSWRGIASRLHIHGILERAGLVNLRWLSPEHSSGKDMVTLAKATLQQGASYLNMTFHSTTLLPGKSPYVRAESDLNSFLENMEMVLKFAAKEGLIFSGLSHSQPVDSALFHPESQIA
jgi:hypothetical protein